MFLFQFLSLSAQKAESPILGLYSWHIDEKAKDILMVCVCMLSRYSCVRLCEPMDYSLPGSSIHGFLQPRILEWITMPSSRGSSQPRDRTHVSYVYPHWKAGSLPLVPLGKPTSHGSKRNYAWTFFSLRKTGFKGIWEDEVEKHVHQNSV